MHSPLNQRIRRRFGVSPEVHVVCRKDGVTLGVRAIDISEEGVRLTIEEMLPAGLEVCLAFSSNGGPRVERRAVIIWCGAPMGGGFAAGFHFHEPLSRAELEALARR